MNVSPAALSLFRLFGFSEDWASKDRGFVAQFQKMVDDRNPSAIRERVDPKFSAPLLILLDFVIVYIVLVLAGYAVDVFLPGKIGQFILMVVAAVGTGSVQ